MNSIGLISFRDLMICTRNLLKDFDNYGQCQHLSELCELIITSKAIELSGNQLDKLYNFVWAIKGQEKELAEAAIVEFEQATVELEE